MLLNIYHLLSLWLIIIIIYHITFVIFFILDLLKIVCTRVGPLLITKIHTMSTDKSHQKWIKSLSLSYFNLFITIPLTLCLFLCCDYHIPETFNIINELLCLVIYVITAETWFFIFHGLCHKGIFYKYIHKYHHIYTSPVAINSLYGHPLDISVASLMSLMIGPILKPCHASSSIFYVIILIFCNSASHAGYEFKLNDRIIYTCRYHDNHHLLFTKNYGYGFFLDKLCHTEYI